MPSSTSYQQLINRACFIDVVRAIGVCLLNLIFTAASDADAVATAVAAAADDDDDGASLRSVKTRTQSNNLTPQILNRMECIGWN